MPKGDITARFIKDKSIPLTPFWRYINFKRQQIIGARIEYTINKEIQIAKTRIWRRTDEGRKKHLAETIKYHRKKRKEDALFRLKDNLRRRLHGSMARRGLAKSDTMKNYGIDVNKIYEYVGERPSPNHQLDHIIPCAAFDFSNSEEIRKCFAPENHRWITREENNRKSGYWRKDGRLYRGKTQLS